MKKRLFSMFLAAVLVLGMLPAMGLTANAAASGVSVTDATYFASGALKSITTVFDWYTAAATSRLVLMTQPLNNDDLTDGGSYGNDFVNFDAVLSHDSANGTFGVVSYSAEQQVGGDDNTMSISFAEGTIPLNTNKTYYVYLWTTWFGNCYPDNLIAVIKVENGVVQYTGATGGNSYDESAFEKIVAQVKYDVTVKPCDKMTKTSESGAETQEDLGVPMTPVVYTAADGYYFPEDYAVESVNGINVTRDSETQITVSGMPTADTEITLTAPTRKQATLEGTTYGYAYDVQRSPAYPVKNGSISLWGLKAPYLSDGTQKSGNSGSWTLTNLGAYYYLKGTAVDSARVERIVEAAARNYDVSANGIIVHQLKDGDTHVAYGVVVMFDADKGLVAFVGDSLSSGAGYLLSLDPQSGTVEGTATMNTTDWIEEYTVTVSSTTNGQASASVSKAVAGDTITITATPVDVSYAVSSVKYNDGSDHEVTPTEGIYAFTMPASNVTVSVTFAKKSYTVTYKADGDVVGNPQTIEHGGNATAPTVPAKDGYNGVWEKDGTNITENTTINAVYTKKSYTVTYKADGNVVGNPQTVEHGGNATAPAVPAKDGFTGVWEKDGTNITDNTTINAVYTPVEPGELKNETPATNLGGAALTESVDELEEVIPLTTEEERLITNGHDVKVRLEVKDISDAVPAADKTLVEGELDGRKVGLYLDVSMYKQVGNESEVKLTKLDGAVTVTFAVPDELINTKDNVTRSYAVIRVHNGDAEVLTAVFDATAKTMTFETDSFSTYAVTYNDTTEKEPTSPSTADNSQLMLWGTLAVVSLVAVVALSASKKRRFI